MKKFLMWCAMSAVVLIAAPGHALTVNPTSDADVLVGSLLGSGVTVVSNSFTGASGSAGLFSGATGAIGIGSGVILTSGQASLAVGPNTQSGAGANNGLPGTAALDALIPGYSTHDASVLDIVFTSDTGNLFFNFVFASEEYNEWVGSQYNDVFGFFLDGVNIALLPGTTTPVSINNVNNGANSAFYFDNESGVRDTQYDGFTTVLTAQALGLAAGEHTISLQIADAGDYVLDSAIFLQGGSFGGDEPNPNAVPEPGTILLIGSGLAGLLGLRRKA